MKPWQKQEWCIPEVSGRFVACMEDVLDLYAEPYDPRRPVVCFDETPVQLLGEKRAPLPAKPGRPRRQDYEYQRRGTWNLFLFCEPQRGWRHMAITEHRGNQDFARQMQWLVEGPYREAEVVRVVLDNLSTHGPGALYDTFAPPEARRIAKRLQFHYTPTHGSWLNMAEIEFSVVARCVLHRRIPDHQTLCSELEALEKERNAARSTIHWRFTTDKARIKLHRIYPSKTTLTDN